MLYISLFLFFLGEVQKTAEEYYRNGEYEEALQEYKKYLEKGIVNPELYLNIGNCYYRMGEFGESLLYYRRGWFLSPGNKNIKHNIYLIAKREETPNPFFSFFRGLIDRISLRTFSYLLALSFNLLVGVLSICLLQRVKLINFPTYPFLFITGFFFVFSLLGFSSWYGRVKSNWLVITETTIAYSGPGEQFKELMRVEETEEGNLIREENGWWLVQFQEGEGGWIDSTKAMRVLNR
ncbi:MAG: tetratricopeptide repeat protein [candidate division WOR-3 bacterium]